MLTAQVVDVPSVLPDEVMTVLTNQLYIELPEDWSLLLKKYSLWRYRLSETQNNHRRFADKNFYGRFTNAYKNCFDRPFYFFTYDKPYAALYALLPHEHRPEPWLYAFGSSPQQRSEEIVGEIVAPDEVKPHVMIKLMLALCFYEASPNDQLRRVCQSKFYVRVKGRADSSFFTAVEVQPSVVDYQKGHMMTLTVEANLFAKVRSAEDKAYTETGAYYELLDSRGQTYLRQLRPNQVSFFEGDLYQQKTIPGKKTKADWHNDGAKYMETRSYLVRHVQERLIPFMNSYGFRVSAAEEFMYSQPVQATALPLQRFEAIQVVDQRLNKEKVSTDMYMGWLAEHRFPTSDGLIELPFVPVEVDKINPNKPLLVILDAGASAFGYDEDTKALNLLSAQGIVDPYVALYKSIPQVVKQSLNVNYNKTEDFIVATDYLHYHIPVSSLRPKTKAYWKATVEERLTADRLSSLKRNLEVCLTELWLKWVIAGKAECSKENSCLPYLSRLSDEWGFVTDNLLLYFEHSNIVFADLATPEGKKILKGRFTAWSEIKKHFMKRTLKDEEKAEQALPNVHFVLIGKNVLEIECTKTMAMPNWPIIKAIKAQDASKSARSREAIGVYAGGIWYNGETNRYIVSGTESSAGKEERGHHLYQIHQYGPVEKSNLSTLISLLTVTFVRKNRFTVFPYPFDLLRLHRELIAQSS